MHSRMGNPTVSNCTIGKLKKVSDKTAAVLEYSDQASHSIFSGVITNLNTAYAPSTGTAFFEYAYRTGTTDYTNATAESGCQAVFCLNMANSQQVYNAASSANWWARLPTPASNNPASQPFKINRYVAEVFITNTSNIMVELVMYDYVCRNDLYTSASPSGILGVWKDGLYYEANATTTTTPSFIGSTPFQSQLFTQYFKIVKTHRVTINPGATHTHYHTHNVHRTMYPVRFVKTTGFIEGLSSGTIFVAQGQPVEATAGSVGAVTTGIVDLNVVMKYKAELTQKYVNKIVFAPATSNLYQATQSVGAFKAMVDSSYSWTQEIEGG